MDQAGFFLACVAIQTTRTCPLSIAMTIDDIASGD
jgi:hypothetical protein